MKLFIWDYVEYVSGSYHDGGGLMIAAASLERARELVPTISPDGDGKPRICGAVTEPPDTVLDVVGTEERVWVFPDAGCC